MLTAFNRKNSSIFVRRCKSLWRTAATNSAACLRYPLSFFDRPNVVAAKVMYFIPAGHLNRAQQEIAHARSRGYSFDSELSIVERRVAQEVVSRRKILYK